MILPMTVLRRLDSVLEGSKQAVLDMKAALDDAGVVEQNAPLRQAAVRAFYNTSRFTLSDLPAPTASRSPPTSMRTSRGSRPTCRTSWTTSSSATRSRACPAPVRHADGSVKHPGLDNQGMGTNFEELVRRLENNEEDGEHRTPRDAVRLMETWSSLLIADQIRSGTATYQLSGPSAGGPTDKRRAAKRQQAEC